MQLAILEPFIVVTVIVAVPSPTAVTVPLLTIATFVLLLVHLTFLSVASDGDTVAAKVCFSPSVSVILVLFSDTPMTPTVFFDTVTLQVALTEPSTAVTVIFAVPALTALTTPFFTVATFILSLFHFTFLLVALLGNTVAVKVFSSPSAKLRLTSLKVNLVTETVFSLHTALAVIVLV